MMGALPRVALTLGNEHQDEHFLVGASNVGETAPSGEIGILTLKFGDELLHQTGLAPVLLHGGRLQGHIELPLQCDQERHT